MYIKARHTGRSRSTQVFQQTGQIATLPDLTPYTPCSVAFVTDDQVILGPLGPERYEPIPSQQDFMVMAFLDSWGSAWMWESIKIVGSWDDIVKEVATGEVVWVGDGSYNRKIAPEPVEVVGLSTVLPPKLPSEGISTRSRTTHVPTEPNCSL